MPRRLLRYLVVGLVLLVLGGLWAFSFFLFNPFEGAYDYSIATLIPRDVDFYAAKKRLRQDFDPFPRLAFLDDLEASPGGQAVMELGVRDALASWNVESALDELDRTLAELPVEVDPLAVFGGRGLAVAGYFQGPRLDGARWAVYGRTSWLGKLAVELVDGGWALDGQGIDVTPVDPDDAGKGVRLSGGQLTQPLYLARILDVVMVASNAEMLAAASEFEGKRGQDSLGLSAKYADNIATAELSGDELELYLDQRAMAEQMQVAGTWPDPNSTDFGPALMARLFQLGAVRELIGTVDFDRTVSFDLVGDLTSDVLTGFQQRLYDERGFDRDQMFEAARLAPADVGTFAYMHVDVGDLLRELRSVALRIDPALISNLEDFVRSAWSYPDLDPLIDELDAALRDRVAVIVRDYDYPDEVGDRAPPHDDTPTYAWAVVLWPQSKERVEKIAEVIRREDTANMLRIQGATPGSSGLWENTLQGGAKVYEYWNVLVPGTGHIATLEMKGADEYFVLSNENRLLGQVFKLYTTGRSDEGLTRLAEHTAFQIWVNSGLPSANLLAWLAPREMADTTRRIAQHRAGLTGADAIDWSRERPRIEGEVLARDFPGETRQSVMQTNPDSFDMRVQEAVDRFQAEFLQRELPRLQADSERWQRALGLVGGTFLQLASDRKRLHAQARVAVDFATP